MIEDQNYKQKHIAPQSYFMDYVAGNLVPSEHLVIGTHIDMCNSAQKAVNQLYSLGGCLLEETDCQDVSVKSTMMDDIFTIIDSDQEQPETHEPNTLSYPRSLKRFLNKELENLEWEKLMNGVYHFPLDVGCDHGRVRLMMIEPERAVPEHEHEGTELTLVLKGGFQDGDAIYHHGDIAVITGHHQHQPAAYGRDVCFCLASNQSRIKMTSWWGRLLNPFIDF